MENTECSETALNFILSFARLKFSLGLCLSHLVWQPLKEKCGPSEGHCHKLSLCKACRCAANAQTSRKGTAVAAQLLLRLLSVHAGVLAGHCNITPSSKQTQRLQKWIKALGNGPSCTPELLQGLPGSLSAASRVMDSFSLQHRQQPGLRASLDEAWTKQGEFLLDLLWSTQTFLLGIKASGCT